MKNTTILLCAGILIGIAAVLIDFRKPNPRQKAGDAPKAEQNLAQDESSASSVNGDPRPEFSTTIRGVAAQTRTGLEKTRTESVVSVREAYRRLLEEDEDAPDQEAGVQAAARTQSGEPAQTADASTTIPPSLSSPAAVLTKEVDPIDPARLWLPAAMLEPDESIPITSELQVAEWEQLQEEFVQAVDGRAPSNESEREAWIRAQRQNDDLFRAKFGWDAFRQQQLKAYMEGLAPAPPP